MVKNTSRAIYVAASSISITAITIGGIFLSLALYTEASTHLYNRLALACFLISTLGIETRIRMGYRLPRTKLFWIHLCFAIPFLIVLLALAITSPIFIYQYIAIFLYGGTLATGTVLFSRGFSTHIRQQRAQKN